MSATRRAAIPSTALHWQIEHGNIKRLLDFLERELRVVREGGEAQLHSIHGVIDYLLHFSDRYHHAREQLAFAFLAQKVPGLRTTVDRLLGEHKRTGALGAELCALLSAVMFPDAAQRARIEALLAAYLAIYCEHVVVEERDILPRAAEVLSEEEWQDVARAAPLGPDPFRAHGARRHDPSFGSEAEARYRELLREIRIGRSLHRGVLGMRAVKTGQGEDPGTTVKTLERTEPSSPTQPLPRPLAIATFFDRATRGLLLRQSLMLLALILAFLQYYFVDVHYQIATLRNIPVLLLGYLIP